MFSKFINKKILIATACAIVIAGTCLTVWSRHSRLDIGIRIPEKYNSALEVESNKSSLSILPLGAKEARAQVERSGEVEIIRYPDVYEQTDVIKEKTANKVKDSFIFKQEGHPLAFSFELGFTNLEFEIRDDKSIVFFEQGRRGNPLYRKFTIPAPFMIDADGRRTASDDIVSAIENGELKISLSESWLKSAKYPVTLDPTVEINILNVHSHPQTGENWEVSFTTVGTGDLKIVPNDQATIDDDEFTALYCGDEAREAKVLEGDVIFYPDWNCSQTAKVVHKTLRAGKHTLKFDFEGAIAYAYNAASDGYLYRRSLTINESQITGSTNLTNFPVLVSLSASELRTTSNGGHVTSDSGYDIIFTSDAAGTTALNHEIESYASTTGSINMWVRVPALSYDTNTVVYIFYGNSAVTTSQENKNGVWADYAGVWHLKETDIDGGAGDIKDSSAYANNGSTSGMDTADQVAGKIGGSLDFDGTNDSLSVADADSLDLGNTGTIEAWMKTDNINTSEYNFSSWASRNAPDGAGAGDQSGVDSVIVGETIHYGAFLCNGTTADFGYSTSSLSGSQFKTWDVAAFTPPSNCGDEEGGVLGVDSDGVHIYYAALGVTGGTLAAFQTATATPDYSSISSWRNENDPTGSGGNEGNGIDMVIVGATEYYNAVILTGATENIATTSRTLGSSAAVTWQQYNGTNFQGGADDNCSITVDSDGQLLFRGVICNNAGTVNHRLASSSISSTASPNWVLQTALTGAGDNDFIDLDMAAMGGRLFHAAALHSGATEAYKTASSSMFVGTALSWVSRQDASSNPNGSSAAGSMTISVASDGKNMYYGAFIASNTAESFYTASSSLPAHPFVSKQNAYEAIQVGTGLAFDWAGRPYTFGTSTDTSGYDHIVITHDGTDLRMYENGTLRRWQRTSVDFELNANALLIGGGNRSDGTSIYFDGIIDEVRISTSSRSADWIQAEYANQNSTSTFYTLGSETETWNLNQSAFRWFANADATDVGSPLADQNTATSAPAQGTPFRLRISLHSTDFNFATNTFDMKLQVASRGTDGVCDTSFTGESYADLSLSSGAIRFYDNPAPADGATTTANGSDPVHSGHTNYLETYEESNNFTATTTIPAGSDGLWDFPLINYSAATGTAYCFRIIRSSGVQLTSYGVVPEIATAKALISATGTQTASVSAGTANQYIGGSFAILPVYGTGTVSSITLTENGTIDASVNLKNVRLYYELDSAAPYDCASVSYGGSEAQFGATSTSGFSSANGTAAFSGSVAISTTSAMCVYPVMDVQGGAGNGNTIEIEISNPFSDVVLSEGISGPATAVAISGATSVSKPPVEFISVIDPGSSADKDFSSLASWQLAVHADLTTSTTQVFTYATSTANGAFSAGATVTGWTSGAVASSTYRTGTTTSHQLLLTNITGSFQSGEKVYIQGSASTSNYVYLSDGGNSAIAVAKCRTTDGTADDDPVQLTGWTTSSSTYIKIWTDPSDAYGRHKGAWDSSKYWMDAPAINSTEMIDIREEYTKIEGLQVRNANLTVDNILAIYGDVGTGEIVIKDNILKGNDTIYWYDEAIRFENNSGSAYILNNFIYDWGSENSDYGAFTNGTFGNVYVFNNTIQNCAAGIYAASGYVYAINNIVKGTYYNARTYLGSSFASGSDYNSTDGTDAMDGGGSHNLSGQTISFENEIGDDFHLASTDTGAKNNGTSTAGLSPLYQEGCPQGGVCYDIDGTARGAAYDIGADEMPVEFVSTICQNSSAGGGCSNQDYNTLSRWEDKVEADLSASTTRVFSGYRTGSLSEDDTVALYTDAGVSLNATGTIVATTSAGQILVDGIYGTSTPVTAASGTRWRKDASNYWSIQGTSDALGASPIAVAKIDGAWTASDTVPVVISDWGTDSDNYIKAYTTSLARHAGKWDYTKYRLAISNNVGLYIYISSGIKNAWFDGLQIAITSQNGDDQAAIYPGYNSGGGTVDLKFSNNILRGTGQTNSYNYGGGFDCSSGDGLLSGYLKVWNNIVYDFKTTGGLVGIGNCPNGSIMIASNNTVFGNSFGIGLANVAAINNISVQNTVDYFDSSAYTFNNISSDNTSPDGASWQMKTVNFISTSTKDFHLASTDTAAKDMGADLSSTSTLSFTTDIDGFTRPFNSVWDVGADEYSEAVVYRSVSPGVYGALQCGGGSNAMNVATTAISNFQLPISNNIGVGDVIVYNASSSVLFISARASSTAYTVQTVSGTNPPSVVSSDTGWCIFRAYTSLDNAVGYVNAGTENTGIPSAVRNFDTFSGAKNLESSGEQWNVACYSSTSPDTTAVTIDGWTTSASKYLKIYTPTALTEVGTTQRHAGKWDDTKYRHQSTNSDNI